MNSSETMGTLEVSRESLRAPRTNGRVRTRNDRTKAGRALRVREKEPVQRCKQKKASCRQDDHLRAFGESAYEYAEGKHGRGNQGRNRVKRQSTHGALPRCAAASDQRSNRFVQNVSHCRRYRCEVGNLHEGFRNGAVMAAVEDSRDRVPRVHLRGHIFDVAVIACDD
jgi:hypothetical protein